MLIIKNFCNLFEENVNEKGNNLIQDEIKNYLITTVLLNFDRSFLKVKLFENQHS